ncbi:putative dolichyl pyrophosphate Glc1Man9GlcNAc2 alpha-1 3-glucosyltransferase [Bienertia sinuspersici]
MLVPLPSFTQAAMPPVHASYTIAKNFPFLILPQFHPHTPFLCHSLDINPCLPLYPLDQRSFPPVCASNGPAFDFRSGKGMSGVCGG